MQFPRWFRVERAVSVGEDGMISWIPTSTEPTDVRVHGQVEESKLKDAVQTQRGKTWGVIAALAPRSMVRCRGLQHRPDTGG
jgi:hypothetical protein